MCIYRYLHICLNLSIWSIDGANLNNQMWALSKILNTFLELLIMEFGPVRVTQKNSYVPLPHPGNFLHSQILTKYIVCQGQCEKYQRRYF